MKALRTLNHYIWRYKWHLLLGIGFVFFSNYFRVWQPQVIREGLDLALEQIKSYQEISDSQARSAMYREISFSLLKHGGLVLLLALTMGVLMFFMRQTMVVMSRLIEYDMRKDIFAHYEDLDAGFYNEQKTGDLMSRITEDVSKVRMYLGPGLLYGINLTSLFALVITSMLSVSPKLTLYSLLPLPVLSISIYLVSDIINKRSGIIQKQLSHLTSIAQEVFSGIRVIKSYVQEKAFSRYFRKESNIYKNKSLDLAQVNALFFPLIIFLIGLSNVLVIYIGGIEVNNGNITPGNIAEFIIYVNMLTWPVTSIGWIASIVQQAEASQERINEFLNTEPAIQNTSEEYEKFKGHIEFRNVTLRYPDNGIIGLKEADFEILPGEKIAIIGQTASGKSTLASLLLRLYDPTSGQILIDGSDIRDVNLYRLRKSIGYVPQDVFLFSDTIANNIAFGLEESNDNRIKKYADHAAVGDDIRDFKHGFDTMIGERGVMLSGGQKQRISIARALIKEPEIVILDDCLSAVDAKTEKEIVEFLEDELKDKTTIMITHRIPHGMSFDKIITLDNGEVVEFGHPENLENSGGYYNRLLTDIIEDPEESSL
ncbi:MAG: ABC transporter ATP-binding protein [Saprospiraceae bacterium]|nr:ABC transporter ATP-binding protein [Saprospiraceae bacterium]